MTIPPKGESHGCVARISSVIFNVGHFELIGLFQFIVFIDVMPESNDVD